MWRSFKRSPRLYLGVLPKTRQFLLTNKAAVWKLQADNMADIDVENPPENMETEETPTAEEPTEENDDRATSAKSNNANGEVNYYLNCGY